ncbi:outer membrane beta-barrel family protein [Crocinitomix algicola]|uniref:outer membrane beta-barrel family protein n=1 Tax=Crocinitomix algicola TaxID=1740263 RepID=UPI000872757A|nr:outer membrane beta-barrel family protein [Crocinitomix algicola]
MCTLNFLKLSCLLLFTQFNVIAFSQGANRVTGELLNDNEPIPFANILLKNSTDSTVSKFGVSDTTGKFVLNGVANGKYFLQIASVGFEKYISEEFELFGDGIEIGIIKMISDSELEAVQVLQLRPIIEVEPDKTVFNVDKTLNATGSNGFDLLRKAPGVIIDNNNDIIVEGKSGVQVYIDNKPSILAGDDLINYLKTLQAADIDKLEIITQPSSKYDAAGNAGIINIILKRDKNLGTNGTFTAGYAYGKNHHANSSISINHRNKKSNVYASYSNNYGRNWGFFDMDRWQYGYLYSSETDNSYYAGAHNAKVGTDWFINDNHTLGILVSGNYFDTENSSNTSTLIIPFESNTPQQKLIAENTGYGTNSQGAGNINYRYQDSLGHELTLDLDYAAYNRESSNYQPNLYLNGSNGNTLFENNYRMVTPTSIAIYSAKLDYGQYFLGGKLGAGMKVSMVETDNVFEFFDVVDGNDYRNDSRSNEFLYSENIAAGYINYAKKLNQKWNLQVGVRVEHTQSFGELKSSQINSEDSVRRSYTNLFPSGGLTFNQNQNNMWALNFSRRIQRPNYQSLNPFVNQSSELSFMKGNPFLQPQYAYNTRLSHTFKYRFTTSVSYSYVEDYFAQITDTLGTDKSFLTTLNVADQRTITLGLSLPLQVKSWWNVYLSVNAYSTSYLANDEKFTPLTQETVSIYGQNTFLLPKGFKLELSGWFSSPSVWGGTYVTQSLGAFNAALEKKFFNDRLALRLSGSDIFFTSWWKAKATFGDVRFDGSGGYESQRVAFNLTYNFGNNEMKKIRERKTGLEDENNRTNGDGGGQR